MDINERLIRLDARRRGLDRVASFESAKTEILAKRHLQEKWQTRAANQPHTRYALGAMQEVDPDSTRISLETATRVGKQLQAGLAGTHLTCELQLQGSVPLNVHIRGVSDVDLLVLRTTFLTYAVGGAKGLAGHYLPSPSETSISALLDLRTKSEKILKSAYPAATIDTSGAKCIAVSDGSLPRKVDVVPAHWNDNLTYQSTGQQHDRGVVILDKKIPATVMNMPFLHIKRVSDRCHLSMGGLRKSIRLTKVVKADLEGEGVKLSLSSFDLASLMYHADINKLAAGSRYELAILAETQRHLALLAANHVLAKTLLVPDGSRVVLDSDSKLHALDRLSAEVNDLVQRVALEQNRVAASMYRGMDHGRGLIESTYVA